MWQKFLWTLFNNIPMGKILADGKKKNGLIFAKIDLDDVNKFRNSIPSLFSKKKYSTNF